jgi:UPF0176 protein
MNVAAFYRFLDVREPNVFRDELQAFCDAHDTKGTILVAAEGFNGTLAGARRDIEAVFAFIENGLSLNKPIEAHWTEADDSPFRRMRVRLKEEIVSLGRPDILPHQETGKHVSPDEWNELVADPNVLIIDTRNHYEHELGTFPRSVDPGTDNFRQFSGFAEELAGQSKDRPLAMFCTGGIRCEKATALMLELGFDDVYHLQGGILNYLTEMSEKQNLWDGECFVFDSRVAVDRDLAEGGYDQCHACRRPLTDEDLVSPDYRKGVSCPQCA